MTLEEKVKIIRKIQEFHPGHPPGIDRGWSYYVGGMKDSGDWLTFKMFDAPDEEVEKCLKELIAIRDAPLPVYTEEEQRQRNNVRITKNGIITEYDDIQYEKLQAEFEQRLIWGPKK